MPAMIWSAAMALVFGWAETVVAADKADLVLLGGKIATVDPARPMAEALAARNGRIVAVGSNADVAGLVGDGTKVIRLGGKLAIPGFIEGHGHFTALGQAKMALDLRGAKSWDDIVRQVEAAVPTRAPGEWILGHGWHQEKWDRHPQPNIDGYPVHDALSRVSPKNPVVLFHASGHMCFANAAAMRLAEITAQTKSPAGGEIVRGADGQPTGIFRETAAGLIQRALAASERVRPAADRQRDLRQAIELATDDCLKKGITSFQDAGSPFETIDVFRRLADEHKLKLRLWVMVRDENERMARKLPDYRLIGADDNHLTVRGIKRMMDGALGAHGAWLLEPYEDMPTSTGMNTSSVDSIRQTAKLALEHHFQLCVHAIGDRANRETLNVFEEALGSVPDGPARRWRVEHAQHLNPADIPRFAKLGIIASMQGIHCTSDAVFVLRRLGSRRAEQGAYVWRSLWNSGAVVSNGTDTPVEDVNPIDCFYATVTRKLPSGVTFFPEQKLTREEALKSYTRNCAYAAFEDDIKGTLTPGKLADITVLSNDILHCPDDEIRKTKVVYTIIGGKIVYAAE